MENIKINNSEINFNDSIFVNFKSKGHLIGHIGIGVGEGILAGCLFYGGIAISGPLGWGVAILIHVVTALGTLIYDKTHIKKN